MKKKLVYYIYLIEPRKQTLEQKELYNLHYSCLEYYSHIFDEMVFILSLDDVNNTKLIKLWETKLLNLHSRGKISFEIHKNDAFCESGIFKSHVTDNLDTEGLVFFGHAKGLSNVLKYPKENIFRWSALLYYYSLGFVEEMEEKLLRTKAISFGSFLTRNLVDDTNKFQWFYIGTFFWINPRKLLSYIKVHNIDFPLISDRFYSEEFLGNIYDIWPSPYGATHNNNYVTNAYNYYENFEEILNAIYPEHEDADRFYEYIVNKKHNI